MSRDLQHPIRVLMTSASGLIWKDEKEAASSDIFGMLVSPLYSLSKYLPQNFKAINSENWIRKERRNEVCKVTSVFKSQIGVKSPHLHYEFVGVRRFSLSLYLFVQTKARKWSVVGVKWPSCVPSTPTIWVWNPLKLAVFSVIFLFEKNENKRKYVWVGPFKKTKDTNIHIDFWLLTLRILRKWRIITQQFYHDSNVVVTSFSKSNFCLNVIKIFLHKKHILILKDDWLSFYRTNLVYFTYVRLKLW